MINIDLDYNPDGTERTREDLERLLDQVKINDVRMTKEEQNRLIDNINYKLTGVRHTKDQILEMIKAGEADIDDLKD